MAGQTGSGAEDDAAAVWERAVDLLVKYGILEHRKDGFARDREFAAMWAANVPRRAGPGRPSAVCSVRCRQGRKAAKMAAGIRPSRDRHRAAQAHGRGARGRARGAPGPGWARPRPRGGGRGPGCGPAAPPRARRRGPAP